jgi:P4 family phage/plasmid primase-like protien
LKMSPFKKNILSECRALLFNERFCDNLYSKKHLLGFDNGVYDLDTHVFREGLPDDYLTMTCGYDYDANVDSIYLDEVMKFINDIMPNKAMVDYVLTSLGYGLHGIKSQEFFQVWTGTGGNGKGLLTTLLQCAMGEYYYEPDSKIYTTSAKSSSGANPEIYAIKGRRIIVSQEIDAMAQIKNGFMKSLTGNDKLQARELYQKKFTEFIAQCLPIICCNEIPKFESFEGGIARRANVVPFKFKFVENPIAENHKPIDMSLKSKFRDNVKYYQAFMNIMIDSHRKYVESGYKIHKPDEVVDYTKKFLKFLIFNFH